ncbi:Major royal jelly-related protein [Alteromonas sp. 38]|uniref:L-dopachrome tautomerase-related protein n=1 Tax=Alteromonas TaxID=226 RepID=UPI0012F0167B|nr:MULTISPECIES: L-dopachrome tautomerase-related protein [Alteromonas]CAD5263820.1 Major royal jelly-related protein [Alteromonas sp. 154]VXC18370.1 Major royal jelly-related protein [Alteromonas sp. 38]
MKLFKASLITAAIGLSSVVGALANAVEVGPLEPVTQFTEYRGGGITITPSGRTIISMHPLDNPKVKVVEVMANGSKQPFPTPDWADGPEVGEVGLTSVIGVHSDSEGVVWILDMGSETSPAQIVAWDSVTHKLHTTITLAKSSLQPNSFIQDFSIDEKHGKIYIADMTFGNFAGATKPAIIVVDLKSGKSKRVLENAAQLMPEDRDIVIEASLLASKTTEGETNALRFGLNPIAIDDKNDWLYFGAFTGTKVYRIPTSAISNTKNSDKKLAQSIEVYGPKNPSDGIAYAPGGGILATDLEHNAVGLTTKGHYEILVQDKRLSWPDSLAVSNGYIYVTQDQLHQHPAFSQGLGNAKPPYTLYRFSYQP